MNQNFLILGFLLFWKSFEKICNPVIIKFRIFSTIKKSFQYYNFRIILLVVFIINNLEKYQSKIFINSLDKST